MLPPPSLLLQSSPIVSEYYQSAQPAHAFDTGYHLRQSYHQTVKREPFHTPPIFRKTLADTHEDQPTPPPIGTLEYSEDPQSRYAQPSEPTSSHHRSPHTAPAQQSQFQSEVALGGASGGWIQTNTRDPVSFGSAGASLGHSSFDRRGSEPTISASQHAQRSFMGEPSDSESHAMRHFRQTSSSSSSSSHFSSMKPPVLPVLPSLNYPGQPLHDIPSSPGRLVHGESSHSMQSISSGISSPNSGGGVITPPAAAPRSPPPQAAFLDESTSLQASPGSPESPSGRKQYSFISLAHPHIKKRPRRRYDEIERLYTCNYQGCAKAYGTLNHLNAHVTMQKHGPKRLPNEFKELRKQWRRRSKEDSDRMAASSENRYSGPSPISIAPANPPVLPPGDFPRNRGLTVAIPEPYPIPQPPTDTGERIQAFPASAPYHPTFSPQSAASPYGGPWTGDVGGGSRQPPVQFNPQFHYPQQGPFTPQAGPGFDPEVSPLEPPRGRSPPLTSMQERVAEVMGTPGSSRMRSGPGPVYEYDRRHSSASVSPVDERLRYQMPPPHARASVDHGIVSYSVTLPPSSATPRHMPQAHPLPGYNTPSPVPPHHSSTPVTRYTRGASSGQLPPDSTLLTPLHLPPRDDLDDAARESTPHAGGRSPTGPAKSH